ncbi:MAG: hypothetical protein GC164_02110 [Phycisphaera sp.]|nr:hypothetical protein [Phycisphaera sp.]
MSGTPGWMELIISLVMFVIFVLLPIVGLIVGIVLWARSGAGNAGEGMACGKCGYNVRGLSQLNCPECGADLREAGIVKGKSKGRRGLGIALTIVCGLMLLLTCLLTGVFAMARTVQMPQPTPTATWSTSPPAPQPQPATPSPTPGSP